ncbi:MAG: S8 family serine peptidase [Deltaproteobacteria bacterium]|nr:S8 family serine peptidase [Deltaproteobacteria bacterium]
MSFRKTHIVVALLLMAWLACLSGISAAAEIDPELRAAMEWSGPDESIPVIVTFSQEENGPHIRGRSRAALIRVLKQRHERAMFRSGLKPSLLSERRKGAGRFRPLWIMNGFAVEATPQRIETMSRRPRVQSIRLDEVIQAPATTMAVSSEPEWNLALVRAPEVWDLGYTGEGVVVACMDTGVDVDHPDLVGRWRGGTNSWFDANDPDFDPLVDITPYDPDGHGTGVMGLMVGGDAGGSAVGMAPGAQWIAAKIFDSNGEALESEIHAAFQWLLDPDGDPDTDDAPDVVNHSWGFAEQYGQCIESSGGISFQEDVQILREAGIRMAFSAGNQGPHPDTSVSPANYAEAFAVGAVDETPSVANFSSRGPSSCEGSVYPEVAAPGDRVTFPYGIKTCDLNDGQPYPYVHATGTSLSAPHAAGAMALLLSAFPDLTPYQVELALKTSALDLGLEGPDNDSGHGLIDVLAAYGKVAVFDEVSITSAIHDPDAQILTIVAISSDQPAVSLTAEGYGALDWKSWKGFYRNTSQGVAELPDRVIVNSSGGGTDIHSFLETDTVIIQDLIYSPEDETLTVIAVSSSQPDAVLTAEGYGELDWKSWKGFYRNTFQGVTSRPAEVTVTSSLGGTNTQPGSDMVTIQDLFYSPEEDTLTVIAVSSEQPEADLTAEGFGELDWKSWKGFYRNTFQEVTVRPVEVMVTSSLGGMDTQPVP